MFDRNPEYRPTRAKSTLIGVGIAAFFIGLAAVMSWSAPAVRLHLSRDGQGQINALIEQQLLLCITTHSQSIANITGVRTETYQPPRSREDRAGRQETSKPEMIGYLLLVSPGSETKLTVTPVQLTDRANSLRDYLASDQPELKLWTIANWKFGAIIPLVLASLGGLTLLAIIWSLSRAIVLGR